MPSVRPPTSTGASAGMRRAHRGRVLLLLLQQQLVALRIGCVCWWIISMREAATALLVGMLRVSTRVGRCTTLCSIEGSMDELIGADQGSRTIHPCIEPRCIDTGYYR